MFSLVKNDTELLVTYCILWRLYVLWHFHTRLLIFVHASSIGFRSYVQTQMNVWLWFTSIDEFCRSELHCKNWLIRAIFAFGIIMYYTLPSEAWYICFYWFVSLESLGQLLAEVEGWKSVSWLPTSQNCQIRMFMVVAFCKVTFVEELQSRKKPIHSPNFQHYKFVFWVCIGVDVHDFITVPVFARC